MRTGCRHSSVQAGRATCKGEVDEQIGIDWNSIIDMTSEKEVAKITPELANIFENTLNISSQFWINRQRQYEESLGNQ